MKFLRKMSSLMLPFLLWLLIPNTWALTGVGFNQNARLLKSQINQQHRAMLIASIMEDLALLELSSRFTFHNELLVLLLCTLQIVVQL